MKKNKIKSISLADKECLARMLLGLEPLEPELKQLCYNLDKDVKESITHDTGNVDKVAPIPNCS